jgi:hypothetical protein
MRANGKLSVSVLATPFIQIAEKIARSHRFVPHATSYESSGGAILCDLTLGEQSGYPG